MRFLKPTRVLVIVAVLFILPYFLFLAYFSRFDNDVVFLPGGGAAWMSNPEEQPVYNDFPSNFPAVYSDTFTLDTRPAKAEISLTVLMRYELKVNGLVLDTEDSTSKRNWKRPETYDLLPYLRLGRNDISVHVTGNYSMTLLRAEGEVITADGGKIDLGSGKSWRVVSDIKSDKRFSDRTPRIPKIINDESRFDILRLIKHAPISAKLFFFFLAELLLMVTFPGVFILLDKAFVKIVPACLKDDYALDRILTAAAAVILCCLAVLLYHNMILYDAKMTGDYEHHLAYLNHFVTSWRIPTADEGFQMYNPPLFYILSGALFRLIGATSVFPTVERYAQAVSTISVFLTVGLIFLILKRLVRDRVVVLMGLAAAAFMPISIYRAPAIAADSFAAFFCTLSFYLWLRYIEKPGRILLYGLGLVLGASMLTRYTAIFPLGGIIAGMVYHGIKTGADRKAVSITVGLLLSVVMLVAGVYYLRNCVVFGSPFPMSGSHELYFFRQLPGYRDAGFFSDVSSLFATSPMTHDTRYASFAASLYWCFWYDTQFLFLQSSRHLSVEPIFLAALAVLPSAAAIRGIFISASPEDVDAGMGAAYTALIVTVAGLISGYTVMCYRFPFYSILKAHYLLVGIAPLTCLMAMGLESLVRRSGRTIVALWIFVLCALILDTFWLPGGLVSRLFGR